MSNEGVGVFANLGNSETVEGCAPESCASAGHGADTTPVLALPRPARRLAIKKIPPALRRPKPAYRREQSWWKRTALRLKEDTQFARSTVQLAFALLCIWIGIEFWLFVRWGMSGGAEGIPSRPPGVEGFLPISSLISLKYWLETGIINQIHPSGLFIFLAIIAVSVVVKKAFCSWLCPIGTLSEALGDLGKRLFGRTLRVPAFLDYPLRSLKYLLLLFFVYAIGRMDAGELAKFIASPYNKMADVKMYLFFGEISAVALLTIAVLLLLSVVIRGFWCRYLCPYGALLGIVGWLSPLKITRNKSTCVDCELCAKACPSFINVHKATRVWSDECMSCMACVDACPVVNTLAVRAFRKSPAVPTWVFGMLVAGVFIAVTGLAMLTGHWQNAISPREYQRRFQEIDSPLYQHFRGEVPDYGEGD